METNATSSWPVKFAITSRLRGRRAGFTLVEVLVATSILAFLAGVTLTALDATLKMEKSTTLNSHLNRQAEILVQEIARNIRYSGVTSDGWDFPLDTAVTSIAFSRCTGWDAQLDQPAWGPVITYQWEIDSDAGELDDGLDNNHNGIIDEGVLYRQVGTSVRVPVARNVEKASLLFYREHVNSRDVVTARLGVARRDPAHPNSIVRGAFETEVTLRN
ncbi:MAG: prepilin-type N-terminal cleavage/methylation domain-containing protein [Planctomycetota bacterium]